MADQNFVDYVKIYCRSGNGGNGSVHLHRDKLTAKGGPDGGDGGRGGHIILKGNRNTWTLLQFKYKKHNKADHGGHGTGDHCSGLTGEDVILEVPLGVTIKDADTGKVIKEITEHDEEFILVPGGRGGKGNAHFKTSTNQTPRYAQSGQEGIEGWWIIELKVLADVGLVGFPNAGKSTLLSVITAAKPKIANYPFTTLIPNLGIVQYRDNQSFVVADIPGIIENAHAGKGLGHRFLRHIERNASLLFMIPCDSDDIVKEYKILLNELKMYNEELLDKRRILAITKGDLIDDELKEMISVDLPTDLPIVFISSVAHQGLDELKDILWKAINAELV